MKKTVFIFLCMTAFIISVQGRDCCVLHQLSPQTHALNSRGATVELEPPTDDWYELNHTDNWPEYYLGLGTVMDTFFIVFNSLAPCSVKMVEAQWFGSGTIGSFTALYSDEAVLVSPSGQAIDNLLEPPRPIGEILTPTVTSNTSGTQLWESLDIGGEIVLGDSISMEPVLFGIGFEKYSDYPHPLADKMETKGIRYTYTWFTHSG
ncbi:MAG: hypothetical protein H8E46_06065 [FCB group bacterium]|nr:hypothetical protein [FCB group bacterium]